MQRKVPVQQPNFYFPQRGKLMPAKDADAKGAYKVAYADVVRYGKDLIKSGEGEGNVLVDTNRMESAPVVLFPSAEAYERTRMVEVDDDYTQQDYDLDDRARHEDAMNERAHGDEMRNW